MAQPRLDAEMESPPSPSPPAMCPDCHAAFPNHRAMIEHMGREFKRSNWNTHIHCTECKKYLPTHDALNAHLKRNHQKDQDLDCPACGKNFQRATALVRHIEQKECPRIDPAKLDAVREQKLWFARELQARHFGDYNEEVEAAYMSRNSALRPKAEATVRPHPIQFEPFETDQVDVYWYHQNVIEPRRLAQSSNLVPTIDAGHQKPQLPSCPTSAPNHTNEPQQSISKAGASLLDDFDPDQNGKLQPSLVDYYDAGAEDGSGRHGPWSAFFNPWENDDLIGLSTRASSRASSRPPSPITSSGATLRAQSPEAAVVSKDPARTVATIDDSSTLATRAAPHAEKTAQALELAEASSTRPLSTSMQTLPPAKGPGGRAALACRPYSPRILTPLSNYNIATTSGASGPAVQSTEQSSATVTPQPSQASMALKPTQAVASIKFSAITSSSVKKPSPSKRADTHQALTPMKAVGAVVPAQSNNALPMDDYDEVKQAIVNHIALHDPRNPDFKVQKYWVPLIGKYKCPMPQCFKSFKKTKQFEHHVSTHMVEKKVRYPCPGCKDMFDTIAALIAHTESQSIKCRFRHSKSYGHFLSQALAGIVDVVGEDLEHGTVQFAISKDAKKNFGVLTHGKGDARRSRSDEFKAATAALEGRAADEEEESRKFWEEHEREVEAQKAKEREEEQAIQAKEEQERKIKEQQTREIKQALMRRVEEECMRHVQQERMRNIEQKRKADEQRAREAEEQRIKKVREAEQESARQAKLAQERQIQQQKAKALNEPTAKREPEVRKVAHQLDVKGESSIISEDMKNLEVEERQLLEKMEKLKEQRRKLQLRQEKEKIAKEAAQKEVQPRPAFNHHWW